MRVLVTGAAGSLGKAICDVLDSIGVGFLPSDRSAEELARHYRGRALLPLDFNDACQPEAWRPVLGEVDVAINAAGLYREHRGNSFDVVHTWAPRALFAGACARGLRRLIQVSALGAVRDARHRLLITKTWADDELRRIAPFGESLDWYVVQPSFLLPGSNPLAPDGNRRTIETNRRVSWRTVTTPPTPFDRRVRPMPIEIAARSIVDLAMTDRRRDRHQMLVGPRTTSLGAAIECIPGHMRRSARDYLALIERDAVAMPAPTSARHWSGRAIPPVPVTWSVSPDWVHGASSSGAMDQDQA